MGAKKHELTAVRRIFDRCCQSFLCYLFGILAWLWPIGLLAKSTQQMPDAVTSISHAVYNVHITFFWVCVAVSVAVFGVLICAMVCHRKSPGVKPAPFHGSSKVEVLWALIPLLILVVMTIPAAKVLLSVESAGKKGVDIKATGHQRK